MHTWACPVYWVHAESWTWAFTKLCPQGNCVFLRPLKIWTQIRHLPLPFFLVRSPVRQKGPYVAAFRPLCGSIQLSFMGPQSTVVLGIPFQQPHSLPILPGCWLPCHHSDTQDSRVAVYVLSVENTHNRRCCLLPSDSPLNPFLSVPNNFYLTPWKFSLTVLEMPLFFLSFVTDFAYISSWGFVCVYFLFCILRVLGWGCFLRCVILSWSF